MPNDGIPASTLIPTNNGKKKICELTVGDKIFNPMGDEVTISDITKYQSDYKYLVHFLDKRKCYCDINSLWRCQIGINREKFQVLSTQEIINNGFRAENSRHIKHHLLQSDKVRFSKKKVPVNPYLFAYSIIKGVNLGSTYTIQTSDIEVINVISEMIGADGCKRIQESYQFYQPRTLTGRPVIKSKDVMKQYTFMMNSKNKYIPDEYKYSSVEQRINLIQGLCDATGGAYRNMTRLIFESKRMSDDVCEVLFSLGFSTGTHSIKHGRKRIYVVNIKCSYEDKTNLFYVDKKKSFTEELYAEKNGSKGLKSYDRLGILNIEKIENDEDMYSIIIDDDNHEFLIENYIVAHDCYNQS